MTTVAAVLDFALKDAGVLGEGETATAEMYADTFATLNQMLALWQVERLYVYGMVENSFAPSGAVSYTVGTGGDLNMARPDSITSAFWRLNSLDYPLRMISTFEEYETLCQKTQAGEPCLAFYQPSYPLGTLYVYPQPSTGTIHVISKVQFPTLATTASTITLPPEYIMPIRFSLAEYICLMSDLNIKPTLARMAFNARKVLRRNNVRIPELGMPAAIPRYERSNIFNG